MAHPGVVPNDLLLKALARQAFPLRLCSGCCHCPPVFLCALAFLQRALFVRKPFCSNSSFSEVQNLKHAWEG